MSFPLSHRAERIVDEPEVVGIDRPVPLWRRTLRRAAGVVALAGLTVGLLALGVVVVVAIAGFLLVVATFALIAGRTRIVVHRGQ